jgi:hypothetical protein
MRAPASEGSRYARASSPAPRITTCAKPAASASSMAAVRNAM